MRYLEHNGGQGARRGKDQHRWTNWRIMGDRKRYKYIYIYIYKLAIRKNMMLQGIT